MAVTRRAGVPVLPVRRRGLAGWARAVSLASFVLLLGSPLAAEDPPGTGRQRGPSTPTLVPRLPNAAVTSAGGPLRSAYLVALRTLAAGDRAAALESVVDLETRDGNAGDAKHAERIRRAGTSLAAALASVNGESLVPVMVLRHDLVEEYRRRGNPVLSTVAGNLALTMAGVYAEITPTDEARALAAAVYASIGGGEQLGGTLQTARRLFEEALVFDRSSAGALLGLGAHFELLGRYDLAAAHFSRVHGDHPEDPEGALRLGVNLSRLKRFAHAVPVLRECGGESVPEWIAVVAAQELARALVESGQVGEARVELERAVERFPAESSLHVQLAYVLDLARDPMAARAVIARLTALAPAAGGPSPRLRYCRWPSDALAAVRAELARAAREREAVLAEAISALVARGA